MIVVCPSCQSRYKFDESRLGNRPSARTRCAKCGGSIDIVNPLAGEYTLPPSPAGEGAPAARPAPPPALPKPVAAPSPAVRPAPAPPAPAAPASPPAAGSAVRAPSAPAETPPREDRTEKRAVVRDPASETATGLESNRALPDLPADKRFSLAVLQGAATGQIFPVTSARTTIGRTGADINLDDPEASRQHAALEIHGETAILRDLGSTNGTWIESDRIERVTLSSQTEFRIGSHVLMFIVTDLE